MYFVYDYHFSCTLSTPEYIMYVHVIGYPLQTHYIQLGAVMALGHLISAAVSRANVTAASSDKEYQHIQQTMRKSLYRLGENMSPVIKITLKLICFYSVLFIVVCKSSTAYMRLSYNVLTIHTSDGVSSLSPGWGSGPCPPCVPSLCCSGSCLWGWYTASGQPVLD